MYQKVGNGENFSSPRGNIWPLTIKGLVEDLLKCCRYISSDTYTIADNNVLQ